MAKQGEPVNVMVTSELCETFPYSRVTLYMASPDEIVCQSAQSYSTSVGIAVGVTTLIAFATGVVITAMFLLCWLKYVR